MAGLKKMLEEETQSHENSLAELRHKNTQELSAVKEQLETITKTKAALDKSKQALEAENVDLSNELRSVNASRQESALQWFFLTNRLL